MTHLFDFVPSLPRHGVLILPPVDVRVAVAGRWWYCHYGVAVQDVIVYLLTDGIIHVIHYRQIQETGLFGSQGRRWLQWKVDIRPLQHLQSLVLFDLGLQAVPVFQEMGVEQFMVIVTYQIGHIQIVQMRWCWNEQLGPGLLHVLVHFVNTVVNSTARTPKLGEEEESAETHNTKCQKHQQNQIFFPRSE